VASKRTHALMPIALFYRPRVFLITFFSQKKVIFAERDDYQKDKNQ
jgi:hypothetical protein